MPIPNRMRNTMASAGEAKDVIRQSARLPGRSAAAPVIPAICAPNRSVARPPNGAATTMPIIMVNRPKPSLARGRVSDMIEEGGDLEQ